MTASQKEETAFQSPSLRTMACISAGRERAPSPTTSLRTRRCSAHEGQTASVCSTVSRRKFLRKKKFIKEIEK
uniref:SFRICE_002675 n=1 Tax=Spodoptera frugiperda TaxID=7108 RepID=A0A2H1VI70_SPOFR